MISYVSPFLKLCPKFTYDLCVLNEPYEYDASRNQLRFCLLVTMLITPPKASVPNPTGTTPLYTSMRSAKLTGMLFRSKAVPAPSCGTPSINTFTCLPLNPSSISCMSEPTPPDSRSFIPGSFCNASLKFLVEFCSSRVSTATALKAERLMRPTPLETTTTSSSSVTEGFRMIFCLLRPSARISTSFSTVSNPIAETVSVYFPAGAFR